MLVALPDLGALAAALLLLLIAAALWVLIRLLTDTFGHAPLIGNWVSGTLAGWLNDARNAILAASRASWHAAIDMFNWGNNLLVTTLARIVQFEGEASSAISRLLYVRIPDALANAVSYSLSLYHSAQSYALGLEQQAISWADARITSAEQTALAWANQALAYAAQLFARAEADTLALVARAETDAANLVTQASTALQSQIAGAEALAAREVSALATSVQSAVSQLANDITGGLASAEALAYSQVQALQHGIITDLETTGDAAIRLAWPDAVPDLQALRDVLGADFPWLNDLLGLMAGAGTAGLLGALIRSMATSQAVTRLATDCIVPNCRNLSGLGGLLQDLEGLLAGDLLFGLLAAAVADPQAAARDIEAALYQPAADTVSLISQLLGA